MQYGVVEEFVTSACETVPGLLTVRHQGKLALGLRGRVSSVVMISHQAPIYFKPFVVNFHLLSQLILELCQKQPDEEVITPHLERIRIPAAMSGSGPIQVFTPLDLKI